MDHELTQHIRDATSTLHAISERSGVVADLLHGRASREDYVRYLAQLQRVYHVLERTLDLHADHPAVAPLRAPELYRNEAIEHDLERLAGMDWRDDHLLIASTIVYTRHLQDLAENAPELVGAHAYTRYLADLSGGKIQRKVLSEQYGIGDDALTAYRFDRIDDEGAFVRDYLRAIDLLDLDEDQQRRFVDEVRMAFVLNLGLSMEVAGAPGR